MPDPLRLLFAIKSLVVQGGGAERVFIEVVNELAARGHLLEVATFDRPGQRLFYDLAPKIRLHALDGSVPGHSTPRLNLPRLAANIRQLALTSNFDAAVAFMHSTYVPVGLGLAGTTVPFIASEHTSAAHFVNRPVQRALARLTQRLAFAKTVVSQQVFDEHPKSWRSNLRILPNPVDLAQFVAGQNNWPGRNVILCVGGFRPEKDQKTLLAAFDRVAGAYPDWILRLVGDGVDRAAIKGRAAASPHASRIELPGVVRDIASEYGNAKFLVMPSTYESLGMVAIEAMASGRAVVGFKDCVGAATLIQSGRNGLLVDPGEDRIEALAGALRSLMANQETCKTMGSHAPETVQKYALSAVITQWESLLTAAAASRVKR